jgi:Lon protease-like protein
MDYDRIIPLFPLNLVLFPDMELPLHIFEDRYKLMIGECIEEEREFGVVLHDGTDVRAVGCTARITRVLNQYSDGRMDILTRGAQRFHIEELFEKKSYVEARIVRVSDSTTAPDKELIELAREGTRSLELLRSLAGLRVDLKELARRDLVEFSFFMASNDLFSTEEKQRLLEMTDTGERIRESTELIRSVIHRLHVKRELKRIFGSPSGIAENGNN